jgi:hypothetical protein
MPKLDERLLEAGGNPRESGMMIGGEIIPL